MANGCSLLYDLALLPEEPHLLQLCCLAASACWNTWDSLEASFCTTVVSPAHVLEPSSPLTVLVAQVGHISTPVASKPLFFPRVSSRSLQGLVALMDLSRILQLTFWLWALCLDLASPVSLIPGVALSCHCPLLTDFKILTAALYDLGIYRNG